MSKSLIKHSSIYSIGHVISTIAALISFPVLTKNLSISEYGMVGLYAITISLLTSLNKVGIQHSIIRFYTDAEEKVFSSSLLILISFITITTTSLILITGYLLSLNSDSVLFEFSNILIITASAFLQAIQSFLLNLLIARQQSTAVTILRSIYRVMSVSTVVVTILLLSSTSTAFIKAILFADSAFIILLLFWSYKQRIFHSVGFKHIDRNLSISMLYFAIPMFGFEMSNMIHAFIDRYFIEYFLGSKALGLYTAPYNMATIISNITLGGMALAITPYYLKSWKDKGKAETERLLSQVNKVFLLLIPVVIAGLFIVSEPLFGILATDAYKTHTYLLPLISLGVFLHVTNTVYAAGIQIEKKAKKIFQFVLESTVLNIVLNFIFIPQFGLLAAAIVTAISYLWLATRYSIESSKTIKIRFHGTLLLRAVFYAAIMIFVSYKISLSSDFMTFIARFSSASGIFIIMFWFVEKDLRREVIEIYVKWRNTRRNTNRS